METQRKPLSHICATFKVSKSRRIDKENTFIPIKEIKKSTSCDKTRHYRTKLTKIKYKDIGVSGWKVCVFPEVVIAGLESGARKDEMEGTIISDVEKKN